MDVKFDKKGIYNLTPVLKGKVSSTYNVREAAKSNLS